MMRFWSSLFSLLAVAIITLPMISLPASAQSLDALRSSGAVGERFDGFAVARDSSAAGFVKEVNAKRQAIYAEQAKKQGVSVAQVGAVYAQGILNKAPKGTWVLTESGEWRQK